MNDCNQHAVTPAKAANSQGALAPRTVLAAYARQLPAITARTALFLDFDGTLADLSPSRADVRIPPATLLAVATLQQSLEGALAIVTGRTIDELDRLVSPLRLAVAGTHGAELRLGEAAIVRDPALPPDISQSLEVIANRLSPLASQFPGLDLERKPLGLALHYRMAPQHAALCWQTAQAAIRQVSSFEVRLGNCVVEILPVSSTKGSAILHLMESEPFKGRQPLFAGDDMADESAIAMVQNMGGIGIRIVEGPSTPTEAQIVVPSAHIVRDWLVHHSRLQ